MPAESRAVVTELYGDSGKHKLFFRTGKADCTNSVCRCPVRLAASTVLTALTLATTANDRRERDRRRQPHRANLRRPIGERHHAVGRSARSCGRAMGATAATCRSPRSGGSDAVADGLRACNASTLDPMQSTRHPAASMSCTPAGA